MKTRAEYLEFLGSEFWVRLSLACRGMAGFKCYRCGKRCKRHKCHAHHIRYPDDWYQTTLDDLVCLCTKCHEFEHSKHRKIRGKPRKLNREPQPVVIRMFGGNSKGMTWCRPKHHWVNRGSSSN